MKVSTFLSLLLLCLAFLAAISGYGYYRIEKKIESSREELIKSTGNSAINPELWPPSVLPEPVTRYFNFALGTSQNCPPLLEVMTDGRFLAPLIEKEFPIRSQMVETIGKTAFVHDAKVDVVPGVLWIRFLDIYQQRQFESKKYINSAMNSQLTSERQPIESFLLSYWLLTAPLNPASLLINDRVSWEEIDGNSAIATVVSSQGASVSATVSFNRDGGIKSVELERPITMMQYMPALQLAEFDSYAMQSGIMAPTRFSLSGLEGGNSVVIWHGESLLTIPE